MTTNSFRELMKLIFYPIIQLFNEQNRRMELSVFFIGIIILIGWIGVWFTILYPGKITESRAFLIYAYYIPVLASIIPDLVSGRKNGRSMISIAIIIIILWWILTMMSYEHIFVIYINTIFTYITLSFWMNVNIDEFGAEKYNNTVLWIRS